jgi:hypothetical protein
MELADYIKRSTRLEKEPTSFMPDSVQANEAALISADADQLAFQTLEMLDPDRRAEVRRVARQELPFDLGERLAFLL